MDSSKAAALLAEEILEEAKKEADRIVKEAEREKKTILASARISAKEQAMKLLDDAKKNGEKIRGRILAEGRMRARRELLRKREELIEATLEELRKALKKRSASKEYESFLFKTLERVCEGVGTPKVILKANRQDLKRLESQLARLSKHTGKELELGEAIQTIGGIRAESPDGSVVVDETLESYLSRERERLRVEIAKMIFEGSK